MTKPFIICIFALIFVVNIYAQSSKKNLTVIINEFALNNPKSGISELTLAYDKIETEFSAEIKALNSMAFEMAEKDKELADRINSVSGCVGSISDLLKEREKLSQEHKQGIEDGKRRYDRRYLEIVSPVLEKVDLALKEFAKVKGYRIIKIKSFPLNETLDKTTEFIEFYNKRAIK